MGNGSGPETFENPFNQIGGYDDRYRPFQAWALPYREAYREAYEKTPKPGDTYEFKASKRRATVLEQLDAGRMVSLRFDDGLEAEVPVTDLWQAAERK